MVGHSFVAEGQAATQEGRSSMELRNRSKQRSNIRRNVIN
jgi:hypothetical protein